MPKNTIKLSLSTVALTLLLASCGTSTPNTSGGTEKTAYAPAGQGAKISELLTDTTPPANLMQGERIPQALGQMMALQRGLSGQVSAQGMKEISTLEAANPDGLTVVRLELIGPEKMDLLSGESFDDQYTYSIVGATDTQDRVYAYGGGKYLSGRLATTLRAVGGKSKVKAIITANLMDLIVQTTSGELYLVGQDRAMTPDEIANTREEYAAITEAYREKPKAFETNSKVWKALAGTSSSEPTAASLNDISKLTLADYTLPDGNLNLEKALAASGGKLSANSLRLVPMALTAQGGNETRYDGQYNYAGTLPGGGYAQSSQYWNLSSTNSPNITYYTYSFVGGPWNAPYYQPLIGCSASAAQALIHDIFRKGRVLDGQQWTSQSKTTTGVTITNDALYRVNAFGPSGIAAAFPTSFPTYAILNQKNSDGANFSTTAMNAGHHNGAVANSVWDIAWGLNQMLNKVWPDWYPLGSNQNYVWSEWKTAGTGSGGTMREILATQLPAGKAVLVSYPLGGTSGHTSIAKFADLVSYRSWGFWTGYDAWVSTIDHPNENRLLTGTNVTASGVYTVNY